MTISKTIFISGIFLLIGSIIFTSGPYISTKLRMDNGKNAGPVTVPDFAPYQESALSPADILRDMRRKGWLVENFSEWFVSPTGQKNGSGTFNSPIDLQTAFEGGSKSSPIRPGDIVWLRGGIYKGSFTVKIGGKPDAPIHFRQYPGERTVLDKSRAERRTGTLNVRSPFVWFWDFEVTNTFTDRSRLDKNGKLNPWRGSGINVWAANTKYINLVIHDNGHGFGLWNEEGGTEIYGCLIFNNGNNKKEHGVYAHNRIGTQTISNNLIFNNAGYGLHVYANSIKGSTSGFEIEDNAIFNNGSLMFKDQVADQILVGSVEGVPSERIRIKGNIVYNFPDAPTSKNRGVRLGYREKNNRDVKIIDNLIVSKVPLKVLWWHSVEAFGNTIITSKKSVEIETPQGVDLSNYKFASNNFLTSGNKTPVFSLNKNKMGVKEWQSKINYDKSAGSDRYGGGGSSLPRVFVNQNKYDKNRANLVIYNAGKTKTIFVELSDFLQKGETFEIRDAQNYFGKAVLNGVFDGKPVEIKLTGEKITPPIGKTEQVPIHTGADFAVFVMRKTKIRSNRQK